MDSKKSDWCEATSCSFPRTRFSFCSDVGSTQSAQSLKRVRVLPSAGSQPNRCHPCPPSLFSSLNFWRRLVDELPAALAAFCCGFLDTSSHFALSRTCHALKTTTTTSLAWPPRVCLPIHRWVEAEDLGRLSYLRPKSLSIWVKPKAWRPYNREPDPSKGELPLQWLAQMGHCLTSLDVTGVGFSPDMLDHLQPLTALTSLDVRLKYRWTAEAVAERKVPAAQRHAHLGFVRHQLLPAQRSACDHCAADRVRQAGRD